jgi:N-acetyl-gamma-glutamyl-phosphate reductase
VRVGAELPHIKEVAASNYAYVSGAANGNSIVVMCAIDNLVKGAAGGAMQWLNRAYGFEETTGLSAPAAGWT